MINLKEEDLNNYKLLNTDSLNNNSNIYLNDNNYLYKIFNDKEIFNDEKINTLSYLIDKHIDNAILPEEVQINLPVYITTLNKEGIIVSNLSKSNEVQVQIGSVKTSINIKYLEKSNKKQDIASNNTNSYTSVSKSRTVSPELNVIGLNVDEAIPIVDKFLDDCSIAKLHTVRIVHGKGTGKLRAGIQAFLKKHPHVKSYRIGTFGEGEMGVTIIELK